MKRFVLLLALAALAACAQKDAPPQATKTTPAHGSARKRPAAEPAGEPSRAAALAPMCRPASTRWTPRTPR